jgi:arylsulfatase A-like enzyme
MIKIKTRPKLASCAWTAMLATGLWIGIVSSQAEAQNQKPNIILIVSDDFGYGDSGPYGGGENRGMPTPNLDRVAAEGMTFLSFYAQPSCTPGRAAMQTGRIPNRSGMTTVAFQGEGGGLPAAEWTLASVLKTGGYKTFFTGKWHLGEADYALPNAQGYEDEIRRPLSPQRLHLWRSHVVPRYGSRTAGDVPTRHQGGTVRKRRTAGQGRIQDQWSVRQHASGQRTGGCGRDSIL